VRKLLIIILTIGFLSCVNNIGNFDFEEFLAEFQKQRAAWENLGIDHYRFTTFVHSGIRVPDFVFTIFPHSEPTWRHLCFIDAQRDAETEARLGIIVRDRENPIEIFKGRTICEFFESLEGRILSDKASVHGDTRFSVRFYARYNEKYFYPEEIFMTLIDRFGALTSDIWVFEIRSFEDMRSR